MQVPFASDVIGCLSFLFDFCRIKSWVDKMQEDLVTLARTASGVDQLAEVSKKMCLRLQ